MSLAIRHAVLFSLIVTLTASPCSAFAIPVFDAANVAQSTVSAVQSVKQSIQLALSYKLQLEQYAGQVRDLAVPAAFLWDEVNETIDGVRSLQESIRDYGGLAGNIHDALKRFGDIDYYRASPCYNARGASGGCWRLIQGARERDRLSSAEKKRANDALFETIDHQQRSLEKRSRRLEQLQRNAQSAEGQLQAVQYANQLSSAQLSELMELRALLVAQQNVAARQSQAAQDREAMEKATAAQLREAEFEPSPLRRW